MKKFLMLITAVLLGFAVAGCQKMPEIPSGEGELEVFASQAEASPYGYSIAVYPYAPLQNGAELTPIATEKVYKSKESVVFRLNVGNYLVNYHTAVQIKEGERITITI